MYSDDATLGRFGWCREDEQVQGELHRHSGTCQRDVRKAHEHLR